MRAKEFTINVPISIKINGDGEPEVDTGNQNSEKELDQNPVMVPPLQQELELKKAELGKDSPVVDKLVADDDVGEEPEESNSDDHMLDRIRSLIAR